VSRVSAFLTAPLTYLKKMLSLSNADEGRELAHNFPHVFFEWAAQEGIIDEEPEDIWEEVDNIEELLKDDKLAAAFRQETHRNDDINRESDAPPFLFMSYESMVKNEWLIHFTGDALAIASQGFKHGVDVDDLNQLGLSTHWKMESKRGGFNFAYDTDDFKRYGKGQHGQGWKYGKEAVVFQANGIRVWHYGDDEPQIIFEGKTARNIVPIREGYDSWEVISQNTGNVVYKNEELDEVVNWVIRNFQQYRKPLLGALEAVSAARGLLSGASKLSPEDEKWLEEKLLEGIQSAYAAYRQRPHLGEPSLTTAILRGDLHNYGLPIDIKFLTRANQDKAVRNALERLRRAGKVTFSWGAGRGGKEVRVWEPA